MRHGIAAGLCARVLFAGLCALPAIGDAIATEPASCAVPQHRFDFEPKFPNTLAALDKGEAVIIVVIGGGSTAGRAAGAADKAWPARLDNALAERFPKARVTVLNKGVARNTARDMVARFDTDVLPHKPNLVIWETGIADAVRGTDLDEFREDLQSGIDTLKAHVPEVMLMDMQFSRRSDLISHFSLYLVLMRGAADINDIGLFPRHEIMRGWSEAGVFDFDVKGQDKQRLLATKLYDCLGKGVADFLMRRDPGGTTQ
jgi:acyl-CoA thioesterase I